MVRCLFPLIALAAPACVMRAPPSDVSNQYNQRCADAIARGQLDEAEALCDHALEFCDYSWDAQTNKGLIRKLRGDREGARQWFIKALRTNRDTAQAANNLGVLYVEDGRFQEAEDVLRQALVTNPDYAEARFNLALVKLKRKRPLEAEKAYRQLTISAPEVTDGYLGLTRALLMQSRAPEALPIAERATLMEPGRGEAWLLLGLTHLELARRDAAREALVRCLEEDAAALECRHVLTELDAQR